MMQARARVLRRVGFFSAFVACGAACSDHFDASRRPPSRGTIGEEVFTVLCSRVGAQALPEDLTGSSFADVCAKNSAGAYADKVNAATLPAMDPEAIDTNGKKVAVATQEMNRAASVARVEALARRRVDLIAALDAMLPTIKVPIKDIKNRDRTKSCNAPEGSASGERDLSKELADMLSRFTELYNDGTLPQSTQSLARLMNAFRQSSDAQKALATFAWREGYRPMELALGVARPALSYPNLRDVSNATLSLLSADSDPYQENPERDAKGARKPIAGKANGQFNNLLEVVHEELRTAQPDTETKALAVTSEAATGREILSRPRKTLEVVSKLMYAVDPSFGGGAPRYIVKRDARGFAVVPPVGGKVPTPFVDADNDGLPDLSARGAFVTVGSEVPPTPFFALGQIGTPRDAFGRAMRAANDELIYEYIDTSHTLSAQIMSDVKPLVNPEVAAKHETLMYALAGAPLLLGSRTGDGNARACYGASGLRLGTCGGTPKADDKELGYNGYDPRNSPLLDLVYASAQILGDKSSDDTLALVQKLVKSNMQDIARVVGAALKAKAIADKHPEANLKDGSTFWDEFIDVFVRLANEPGLLEDSMKALADEKSASLGKIFSSFMSYRDRITYDRNMVNGPAFNVDKGDTSEMSTPVDRTMPDAGFNRSGFQRFVGLLHDTNGVTACNKPDAIVHAKGLPLDAKMDLPNGITHPLRPDNFKECEVFKIENLSAFYLDSIVGKATLYMRDDVLQNGLLGFLGATTTDILEKSSGLDGFWGTGKDLRPKPNWLNRLVFFDQENDTRDPTQKFLKDLQGPYIGTTMCPERVIVDPKPRTPNASPDGMVRGLRQCQDGDWLQQRRQNTIFEMENFGFYNGMTPLLNAFISRKKEDIFIDLMEVVHRHYASDRAPAEECVLSREPGAKYKECSRGNIASYEPLMAEIFAGDLLPALQSLLKKLQSTTIAHCDAVDASTRACTKSQPINAIAVLAEATRALVDPARAKAANLKDRRGVATAARNDGTTNPQTTPLYLALNALKAVDKALDSYAPVDDSDKGRKEQWKMARSQLVDQFVSVDGEREQAVFRNPIVTKIAPMVVDILRAQLLARCPASFAPPYVPCTWATTDLPGNVESTMRGPLFAAAVDVTDTIRRDETARVELEKFLQYLLDAASQNDALAAVLASSADAIQILQDDQRILPLLHTLSEAAKATVRDDKGNVVEKSLVDAQLALLARMSGRAYATPEKGGDRVEICANEIDPNQILTVVLQRAVTPMDAASGTKKQSPLEVIMDVIADVNRVAPATTVKFNEADYANVADNVSDFLLNKERGLEQFYEIVRQGTKRE
jgi:hypothetical protein